MAYKKLIFFAILFCYSFLYIATSRPFVCPDDDCEKMAGFQEALRNGRESYVINAYRCSFNRISDTICVYVRDTSGINWNLLADTACNIATQKGLLQQKIFLLKLGQVSPVDTVVRRQCP